MIRRRQSRARKEYDTTTEHFFVENRFEDQTSLGEMLDTLMVADAPRDAIVFSFSIHWERPSTAEEQEEWRKADESSAQRREVWERETLDRLRKKYEGDDS